MNKQSCSRRQGAMPEDASEVLAAALDTWSSPRAFQAFQISPKQLSEAVWGAWHRGEFSNGFQLPPPLQESNEVSEVATPTLEDSMEEAIKKHPDAYDNDFIEACDAPSHMTTEHSFLIGFPKWPILDLCPSSFLIGFISNWIHF